MKGIKGVLAGSSRKGIGGQKGRSGPPGNLNATRNPWRVFWKRRALKPEDRWIAVEAARYKDALLSDHPNPTEAERRAIELASESKACRLLIWTALKTKGFTESHPDGLRLVPAAADLPKFIGTELGALRLLGLERKVKPMGDIAALIQEDLHAGSHDGEP